jgi:hypothetical protein
MEEEITRPFYGHFLMMVRERHTERVLIDAEEFRHFFGNPEAKYLSERGLTYDAKCAYLQDIERRKKYVPKIRELLEGITWFIDGVLISKEMIKPAEYYQARIKQNPSTEY